MIETVINKINSGLAEIFKYPGIKIYGLTQSMKQQDIDGTITVFPAVVDEDGEGIWVGVDDVAPMIIYHKSLNVAIKKTVSYGDESDTVSLFGNQMIVFFDRSKINLNLDEIHLFVVNKTPERLKMQDFRSIRIFFQSVNLNSQSVFQGEYQNTDILPPEFAMVAINYQVESIFSKNCFPVCP